VTGAVARSGDLGYSLWTRPRKLKQGPHSPIGYSRRIVLGVAVIRQWQLDGTIGRRVSVRTACPSSGKYDTRTMLVRFSLFVLRAIFPSHHAAFLYVWPHSLPELLLSDLAIGARGSTHLQPMCVSYVARRFSLASEAGRVSLWCRGSRCTPSYGG